MNTQPFIGDFAPSTIAHMQATLMRANNETLATIIAKLLNEHEPLLKAEVDGATVRVTERGGDAFMRLTVQSILNREAPLSGGE